MLECCLWMSERFIHPWWVHEVKYDTKFCYVISKVCGAIVVQARGMPACRYSYYVDCGWLDVRGGSVGVYVYAMRVHVANNCLDIYIYVLLSVASVCLSTSMTVSAKTMHVLFVCLTNFVRHEFIYSLKCEFVQLWVARHTRNMHLTNKTTIKKTFNWVVSYSSFFYCCRLFPFEHALSSFIALSLSLRRNLFASALIKYCEHLNSKVWNEILQFSQKIEYFVEIFGLSPSFLAPFVPFVSLLFLFASLLLNILIETATAGGNTYFISHSIHISRIDADETSQNAMFNFALNSTYIRICTENIKCSTWIDNKANK